MSIFTISEKNKNNDLFHFVFLFTLSVICIFLSIIIGASTISFEEIVDFFTGQYVEDYVRNIILLIRVPRALGGFLCGFALAISGLLLKMSLNNALASPSTIGVNTGAALFVLIIGIIFPANYFLKTFSAFVGAVFISIVVYYISVLSGSSKMTIILAGTAITSLCNAIIDSIIIINPDSMYDKTAFYIGGLSGITYNQLIFAVVFIAIGFLLIMFFCREIDIMILGDELASTLGVNTKKVRFIVLISASLMAGASVAVAGLLGFVGLVIPHISLMVFKNESKTLIPKTGLLGGIFVVVCDLFARIIFTPYEVPVGIILSFVGAPFFLYLLFSGKKRGRFYD